MKKLLSLLGAVAISASAGTTALAAINTSTYKNQNNIDFNKTASNSNFQIDNLKKSYNALSENEKTSLALEMTKLAKLDLSEINQYLANSNNEFIRNNKATIENMFTLFNSMDKISNSLSVTAQSIDINWTMINEFIDLDFGSSNDYTPTTSTYGPAHWWTAIWDWGWKIDFPEGDINVMRVVKLIISLYNGINFKPLERIINSGKNLFDYLVNIDQHDEDKVSVLYDLVIQTENDFKNSGIPFTQEFYDILNLFTSTIEKLKNIKVQIIKNLIKATIKDKLGVSLEKIGADYSGYLNQITTIITTTNKILDIIKGSIPGLIWNFIIGSIALISNQMIKADANHKGVYLKFQQFIIPLGFGAR